MAWATAGHTVGRKTASAARDIVTEMTAEVPLLLWVTRHAQAVAL